MTSWKHYIFVSLSLWTVTAYAESPTVNGKAKIFSNREGIEVTMVPLKPTDLVVLVVEGTHTPIDNVPMGHSVQEQGNGAEFVRKIDGKNWSTVSSRQRWSDARDYSVNIKGRRDPAIVTYNPKKSLTEAEGTRLLERALFRRPADSAFDRKKTEASDRASFEKDVSEVNAACGVKIQATVNWQALTDEIIKHFDVAGACGQMLDALVEICDDSIGKKTVGEKIKAIECQVGSKLAGSLKGNKLLWTTAEDAPDQKETAKDWLGNNL